MAILNCKICGGVLEINEALSVYECQHCGTKQTLPNIDDEAKIGHFNRANELRRMCEFDKAAGVYESIVSHYPDEAEAYWGLVLCKYGVEYVEDSNGSRLPTCHRTVPTSIMDDDDFDMACAYADAFAKEVYRSEAKVVDGIQKKILQIAASETPYDVFICYKERDDESGIRTEDSNIAQDIYTALTQQGYRVFYSRITLRELAGSEYEPYIYAALSSAKVMVAIGTKQKYFDAVWVKNEWSRFISMMRGDKSKVLIPCYKNMDGYDIPKELRNMQALDIGDLTFLDSLKTSIERIVPKGNRHQSIIKEAAETNKRETIENYFKRIGMFLDDGNFASADEYCEKILDMEPENGYAYLYKFMAEAKVSKIEDIKKLETPLKNFPSFIKAHQYGDDVQQKFLCEQEIIVMQTCIRNNYDELVKFSQEAVNSDQFYAVANCFKDMGDYENCKTLAEKAMRKGQLYDRLVSLKNKIIQLDDQIVNEKFDKSIYFFECFDFLIDYTIPKILLGLDILIWIPLLAIEGIDTGASMIKEAFNSGIGDIIVTLLLYSGPVFLVVAIAEVIIKFFGYRIYDIFQKRKFKLEKKQKVADKVNSEKEYKQVEEEYNNIKFLG